MAPKANQNPFNNARPSSARNQSSMVRCSSVGVLNRADSETELNSQTVKKFGGVGKGLMRPTISSQNKVAAASSNIKNINSGLAKRRIAAFSSG